MTLWRLETSDRVLESDGILEVRERGTQPLLGRSVCGHIIRISGMVLEVWEQQLLCALAPAAPGAARALEEQVAEPHMEEDTASNQETEILGMDVGRKFRQMGLEPRLDIVPGMEKAPVIVWRRSGSVFDRVKSHSLWPTSGMQ